MENTQYYDSRFVIYDCRAFIRLATGLWWVTFHPDDVGSNTDKVYSFYYVQMF